MALWEWQRNLRRDPGSFTDEELKARTLPDWVGSEVELTVQWLRAIQGEPTLWLRARAGQGKALEERLPGAKEMSLPDALIYEGDEDLLRTAAFHEGQFEIQDIASQAVGVLCAPKPGETWWDACAGEGGKLLHLVGPDAKQGTDLGQRPGGVAIKKFEAANSPGALFQLPGGGLGWQREVAHENEIRRSAGGCAVQRHWHMAAESARTLDDVTQ